jgi:hypothetical protein
METPPERIRRLDHWRIGRFREAAPKILEKFGSAQHE